MAAEALEERLLLTVTTHSEDLDEPNPPVGPVMPQAIETYLLPTDESTHTVTLAIDTSGGGPDGKTADIVFVVDESQSMEGEQAWLGQTVTKLEAELAAANITNNRYALIGYAASASQARFFSTTPQQVIVSFYDETNTRVTAPKIVPVDPKTGVVISEVTLPRSGEYRVEIQSTSTSASFSYSLVIGDRTPTAAPSSLALNQLMRGRLVDVSAVHNYPLTLANSSTLYFEALSQSNLQWSLTGTGGTIVDDRNFTAGNLALSLAAGNYTLSVSGPGNVAAPYAFRLVDVAGSAFTAGATVTGTLATANRSNVHRFTATAGDRLYFETKSPLILGPYYRWTLLDPAGNALFENSLLQDRDTLTAPVTGDYSLVIDGNPSDASANKTYKFVVHNHGPQPAAQSIAPSAITAINTTAHFARKWFWDMTLAERRWTTDSQEGVKDDRRSDSRFGR